jgi:magnesium transporter
MRITLFTAEGYKTCEKQDLEKYLANPEATIWVDLTDKEDEGANVLRDIFKFHPLAIEDTRNQRQRPKIEEYNGYLFMILNSVITHKEETLFHEVNAFVGNNYLVTVHSVGESTITEMETRVQRNQSTPLMSAGYLLYTLLDTVVDDYFPVLDTLSDRIETMEENVLSRPQKQLLDEMFHLRRMLSEMWRVVGHQRDMFGILMHHQMAYNQNEALQYYMRDVYDHLIRISDTVNTFRDLLTGMVELYMSAVSNRLNIIVTRLTILTLVIGGMTVISGVYGMNFQNPNTFFPPLNADWGVLGVIAMMSVVVVIGLLVYRSIKWE